MKILVCIVSLLMMAHSAIGQRKIGIMEIGAFEYFPSNQLIVPCSHCDLTVIKVEEYAVSESKTRQLFTHVIPLDSFSISNRFDSMECLDVLFQSIEKTRIIKNDSIIYTRYPRTVAPFNAAYLIPKDTSDIGCMVATTVSVLPDGIIAISLVGPVHFFKGPNGIAWSPGEDPDQIIPIGSILFMWGRKKN